MDAINDWENQALTHRNRLAPHAYFMGYETADLAATYSRELSRGFVQLSGSWQFRLFEGPAAVSNEELSTYEPEWDHVEVPHLWQVDGYGNLAYTDEAFKGLDDQCRRDTVAYIRRHTPGASLLCVTHDPEEAALLGGRCLDLSTL